MCGIINHFSGSSVCYILCLYSSVLLLNCICASQALFLLFVMFSAEYTDCLFWLLKTLYFYLLAHFFSRCVTNLVPYCSCLQICHQTSLVFCSFCAKFISESMKLNQLKALIFRTTHGSFTISHYLVYSTVLVGIVSQFCQKATLFFCSNIWEQSSSDHLEHYLYSIQVAG